jgi:hypothetical protein
VDSISAPGTAADDADSSSDPQATATGANPSKATNNSRQVRGVSTSGSYFPGGERILGPLGICLGTFMSVGLRAVSDLSEHGEEYVAWSWTVNGFASVVGSVLPTLLAMFFGFTVVLAIAVLTYAVALAALYDLLPGAPHSELAA